jgi:hypothetical protein
MILGLQLLMPVADDMPRFDVRPNCQAAASLTPASLESCLRDEEEARSALQTQWSQFAASDRTQCRAGVETGGSPSYVELLTCLQMAQDVRKLPKNFE